MTSHVTREIKEQDEANRAQAKPFTVGNSRPSSDTDMHAQQQLKHLEAKARGLRETIAGDFLSRVKKPIGTVPKFCELQEKVDPNDKQRKTDGRRKEVFRGEEIWYSGQQLRRQ